MSSRDTDFLAKIASWYYEEGLTQEEIARRTRLSRPSISRLLSQARDLSIVQVKIVHPFSMVKDLENRLEAAFNLKEAVVSESPRDESWLPSRALGIVAAGYLERILRDNDVLGVSWGTTLYHVVQSLPPRAIPGLTIVQLCGGLAPLWEATDSADLVRKMAALYAARAYLLQGPLVVGSDEAYESLVSSPAIACTLEKIGDVNVAMVGIGALEDSVLMRGSVFASEQIKALRGSGAVGDICARFLGPEGQEIPTSSIGRLLGITLEQLRGVEHVVAVAGGDRKVAAIRAALLTGAVDVLITDSETAAAILKLQGQSGVAG